MIDPVERLVNVACFLAASREPVTAQRIRAEVSGYPDDQSEEAFLRMFERDKDDLRSMGFAIESPDGMAYSLNAEATFSRPLELTPAEAATVRIAATAVLDDPSFPFGDDVRRALAKTSGDPAIERPRASARLADEEPEAQGRIVAAVSDAAVRRKRVTFDYTNASGTSAPHEIEPYGLFLHDGRWYVVGRDVAKDDARTYAVARMGALEVNATKPKTPDFERPDDFDVARFVQLPFQYGPSSAEFDAVVRFAPEAAWRARALSAGTGERTQTPDGAIVWKTSARSAERLARFVIENGPGLTLVEPAEATALVRDGLARVVAAHG